MNLIAVTDAHSSSARTRERTLFESLCNQLRKLKQERDEWMAAGHDFCSRHDRMIAAHVDAMLDLDIAFLLAVEKRVGELHIGYGYKAEISESIRVIAASYIDAPAAASKRATLIEIFNRHSSISYEDLQRRQILAAAAAMGIRPSKLDGLTNEEIAEVLQAETRRVFESLFGSDSFGDEDPREAPAPKSSSPKPTGPSRLREVYRALVRQLHPDREPDPERRLQKTALMQKVNEAYRNHDLPTLLDLQVEAGMLSIDERNQANGSFHVDLIASIRRQLSALRAAVRGIKDDIRSLANPICELPRRLTLKGLRKALDRMEAEFRKTERISAHDEAIVARASPTSLIYLVRDRVNEAMEEDLD